MFRSKTAVDRHVQELFRKVNSENERNLRCYNIAKLYFQVADYESARRYLYSYLEVKPESPGAHKLLGQILEALGQKELALAQYKESLELDGRQDDLVLRICELLVDNETSIDVQRIKYWIDRAGEKFANHQTVFRLKEKLVMSQSNVSNDDLEALIVSEIASRPLDIHLRVKLIKYYTTQNRMEDAYKHAVEVEITEAHRDSIAWYEALCEFLSKYKEGKQLKCPFWVFYISSLERFAALALKEHGNPTIKTIQEAGQAVSNFDQALTEAKRQNYTNNLKFMEQMFEHMWGQLQYHLACLLMRRTKRDQKNWTECGRICSALMLGAIYIPPIDPTAPWAMSLKEQSRAQVLLWSKEGAYRCSQAGHVLQEYANDNPRKLLNKIEEFCHSTWREQVYKKIFVDNGLEKLIATSYFVKSSAANPPLRLLSTAELRIYDQIAKQVWPGSLHHHVWLGIVNKPRQRKSHEETELFPNEYSHVFPDLQLSVYNLSQAVPDSLGQLDIDAFLNAAILCASANVTEQQKSGFLSPDRMPTLPADITNPLCTSAQENWWSMAYRMYRKQENISGDLSELRQTLQRGLEVIRCIGSHGLHPSILAHLARIFHHRAKILKAKDSTHHDLSFLEARYELYWSVAVSLLERLLNNQTIRSINNKLFELPNKEMGNLELTNALEEGRLVIAQKLLRDKLYEQAIDALQSLKCPEASYLQGEIYKQLADEFLEQSNASITSPIRSQHVAMLNKAKSSYYLTLDRLRSPGTNPNHPLNAELGSRIASIESELKRIGFDGSIQDGNRNDYDALSDVSYSSAHSATDQPVMNNLSMSYGNAMLTPQRSVKRTPKKSSTPRHHQMSRIQQEARPSPERLDAQIRQLIHTKDTMIQSMMDQQKVLIDTNKQLFDAIETLRKEVAELRLESQQKSTPIRSQNIIPQDDESPYIYEEDYVDMNFTVPVQSTVTPPLAAAASATAQVPRNIIAPNPPRQSYPPMMYPPQPPLGGFYHSGLPLNQHLQSVYSQGVWNQMSGFYPRPADQALGGMSQLQQSLFNPRMMNQLTDMVSPQLQQHQQPQQPPMYGLDLTRNDLMAKDLSTMPSMPTMPTIPSMPSIPTMPTIPTMPAMPSVPAMPPMPTVKDAPLIKAPPVNVVITTSDTLPTTVPTVQPTLSVTIPAHHINVGNAATNVVNNDSPHKYQISMPSQAMIPTTVNLPPLSSTITTTIAASISQHEKINLKNNTSIVSTGSHNSSIETVEVEHDPIPDFVPVIPLPAEVKVTTGEEDEETLFCARAKLFRFVDKEWKERGVGNVKLLRNKDGKVRLLMRRDQVLKICANHLLTRDMNLTPMANNDKAFFWVANDFADEEVRLEKLCIRFKLAEEAQSFKESFEKAKKTLLESPVKAKSQEKIVKPEKIQEKPVTVSSTENKTVVGGFSFTAPPIIQQKTITDNANVKKPEEIPKPSPFAGFSFTKTNTTPGITSNITAPAVKPLSELFKPAAGSWECKSCYTRNNAGVTNCIACAASGNVTATVTQPISTSITPNTNNQQSMKFSAAPLSELFKPATDSWECKACYIRNSKSNSYCVACDSPSDSSLPPKPKSIGFGVKQNGSGPSTTFTFGIPSSNASNTNNVSNANNTTEGFNLGVMKQLETPAPPSSFVFGLPGKSFDFQFPSKSPVKSPADCNASEDEVVESEDVYFAPVIPLPDKIEVKTGEEDEEVLYTHRAKLFRYDSSTKEWKERGLGDIKLLRHQQTKKLRLVMRRDQTLKLCLNHIVPLDLEMTPKDEKTWLWNAADYSDGEIEYVQLACRFKTPEIAGEFKKSIDSSINEQKSSTVSEKPKLTVKPSCEESVQDVEVVYETSVSPEEKSAALKLKLPENFYAYKQKEDCPGCIGCKEPDVPLFEERPSLPKQSESPKTPVTVAIAPPKFNSPQTSTAVSTSMTKTASLFSGNSNTCSVFGKPNTTFSTPIFGGGTAPKDDKSIESKGPFVFNPSKTQEETSNTIFDKTICSPADSKSTFHFGTATQSSFGSQSIFGNSGSTFKGVIQIPPIFGETTSTSSIFSGTSAQSFTMPSVPTTTATTETAVASGQVFSQQPSTLPTTTSAIWSPFTNDTKDSPPSFASLSAASATSNLSSESTTKPTLATSTPQPFGSTSIFGGKLFGNTSNLFGAKTESPLTTKEPLSFLDKADNSTDFSALAAKSDQPIGFKTDPNFTFAGAGTSVFGGRSSTTDSSNQKQTPTKSDDAQGEADDEDNENQEYDPHYEPIIPLPDAVEVRTGEEDEERVFSHRAKLYRYEATTKEWKERGVGEMKLLYHPEQGTYRLLLRREQVHKVVCNFLLTPNVDFQPLKTSDTTWMWAGINYVDDKHAAEQLAVRFKTQDLAKEFKAAVERAQNDLRERRQVNEDETGNHYEGYQVDEEDDDEDVDDDEEDDDQHSIMFDRPATLSCSDNGNWRSLGDGQMKMVYDSDIFGARAVFESTQGEILCNTLISIETEMEVNGNDCIWNASDEVCDPPVRRTLKASFLSDAYAQEMMVNFHDGLEFARQADIREI